MVLYHEFFHIFWHGDRSPYEFVHDKTVAFGKTFFAAKIGKMDQKMGQKQGFLSILKNVVINFYRICYIMKIYIIFCVLAPHIWENFCL